jgi:hypothetical protein
LNALTDLTPTVLNDMVNPNGVLVLVGVYATQPNAWIFEQDFIKEDGQWQLAVFKMGQMNDEVNKSSDTATPTIVPTRKPTMTPQREK